MASKEQVSAFIEKLAAMARNEYLKRDRWVLPSICIAQAALETGWGTSSLMLRANAYFGIKATSSWGGKVFNSQTSECYDGVSYTEITAAFRAYDNAADSVADYFDLITNSSRYAGGVCNPDAESTITAIRNGGYATSPTYIKNVMSIVNSYNLTQYDARPEEAPETPAAPVQNNTGFEVGDKVRVTNAVTYDGVPFSLYYGEYDVIQINGDRVVIGIGSTVTAAVNACNLEKAGEAAAPTPAAEPEANHGFNAGDKARVINAVDYYGGAFKCWYDVYDVIQVNGDRVVIGIGSTVTAAVNAANLAKA